MTVETFGKKFRVVRDRGMTPQDSWKWRHGHLLMGCTFPLCAIKPITDFEPEDLMWVLLEAASLSLPTDIQIYFGNESHGDIAGKINTLMRTLVESGFTPRSLTMMLDRQGKGFIRVPLYGSQDLPDSQSWQLAST